MSGINFKCLESLFKDDNKSTNIKYSDLILDEIDMMIKYGEFEDENASYDLEDECDDMDFY